MKKSLRARCSKHPTISVMSLICLFRIARPLARFLSAVNVCLRVPERGLLSKPTETILSPAPAATLFTNLVRVASFAALGMLATCAPKQAELEDESFLQSG